jgi:adenylate cyclase
VTWYAGGDVAERAGVELSFVVRLGDLGMLAPEEPDRFSPGDVRRVLMARSLEDAGIAKASAEQCICCGLTASDGP